MQTKTMKGSLVLFSCLIFTLSLTCNANNIQSWCANAPNPATCVATIQSNPSNDLKSTPQGAAFILVQAAKANARSTTAFLEKSVKSEKYEDVLEQLKGCLMALMAYKFNSTRSALDIDLSSMNTTQGRSDVISKLNDVDAEVTYDCGWQTLFLTHHPPVVKQLSDRVQGFSDLVTAASNILDSIH